MSTSRVGKISRIASQMGHTDQWEGGREGRKERGRAGGSVLTFGSGSKTNWKSWKRMSTIKSTAAKMISTVCDW